MNPLQQNSPLGPNAAPTPMQPGQPGEPVSTPISQQPLGSQGMEAGQVPMPGQEMATPEQRQELQNMLNATQEKMAELQSIKFQSANEKEVARVEALKEIFIMMRDAGVDLNDASSVGSFLDRLRTMNPTMSEMFESTLEDLLSEDMPPEAQQMGQSGVEFGGAPELPPDGPSLSGMPGQAGPQMPAPTVAPAPPSPAEAKGLPNETLPQDVSGPLPR